MLTFSRWTDNFSPLLSITGHMTSGKFFFFLFGLSMAKQLTEETSIRAEKIFKLEEIMPKK